jgi:hypothetical protein
MDGRWTFVLVGGAPPAGKGTDGLDFDEKMSLSAPEARPMKGRSVLVRIRRRLGRAAETVWQATVLGLVVFLVVLGYGLVFTIPLLIVYHFVLRFSVWFLRGQL